MSDIAIELHGLNKVFRLYPDLVRSRIKQHLFFWKRYYQEKTALDAVDLTIRRGEVVGVIGPNGAGKTTLLKVIAGISYPTGGTMEVNGRVVAVLALGLGFHPRLTGLENIELAGMMLGMTRADIRARRDWIVDFAELGDYISRPLTTYSTGMRARLSFAVAACQEPEILIIDEALATGDVRFVQKCIKRIHEITRSGTTALFVSHNIWSIKQLTSRCILLDQGRIVDDGDAGRVADRYYEVMLRNEVLEPTGESASVAKFIGTGEVKLRHAELRDSSGQPVQIVQSGENAEFVLELSAEKDLPSVTLSMSCWRNDGIAVTAMGSVAGGALNGRCAFESAKFPLKSGLNSACVSCSPLLLAPGDYVVDLHLFDAEGHSGFTSNQQYFFKPRVLEFGVRRLGNQNRSIVFYQPASISIDAPHDAAAR